MVRLKSSLWTGPMGIIFMNKNFSGEQSLSNHIGGIYV